MAQATAKFTYLTTRKLWGSKSPDEEKLIAMIADLKGKLKLGPALEDKHKPGGGKKNDGKVGGPKTKNKKNTGHRAQVSPEEGRGLEEAAPQGRRAYHQGGCRQEVPLVRPSHGLGHPLRR